MTSNEPIVNPQPSDSQSPLLARIEELRTLLREYVEDYPSDKGWGLIATFDAVAQVLSEPVPDDEAALESEAANG